MSLIIVVSAVIVAYFFFPVSTVEIMKGFSAKRASQWKEVFGKKDGKVEVEVDGRKVN
jgi:hypothetical protein